MSGSRISAAGFFAATLLAGSAAQAVSLYGTDSPTANTTAPTGTLAGSGWQFQGTFGPSLGTAIAPSHFITAEHFQVSAASDFVYQGVTYDVIGSPIDDPNSDLRIWQIAGTFPEFAPLYSGADEVGKPLVVFGNGLQRSSTEVSVSGVPKGWLFASGTETQRWGTNDVTRIDSGGPNFGDLLAFNFDGGVSANEAHLAVGDSGGGVFVQEGGVWKLAGVNLSIDGPYKFAPTDTSDFLAAIYDRTGLLEKVGEGVYAPAVGPAASYSTRISSNLDFIAANAPGAIVPEPAGIAVGTMIAMGLLARRRRSA
jgi:hypothetical protein